MRWRNIPVIFLLPALLHCGGAKHESAADPAVPVKTLIIAADDEGARVSFSGLVKYAPDRHALLQTPGNLVVVALHAKPGDRVKAGQLLVSLRPDMPTGDDSRKADLGHSLTTQQRKRIEALVAAGAAPQSQLDEARSLEAQAAAEASGRRQIAGYAVRSAQITAPFAGTVLRVDAIPGQLAQPSQPLVELADLSALQIEILVPQAISAKLQTGLEAILHCANCPDGAKGRITRVFPAPDGASLQVTVWIAPEPGAIRLTPGASVTADLAPSGTTGSLWLPDEAILAQGLEHKIFVVKNGKAGEVAVTVGLHNGGRSQILTGLKPGDRVVVEGGWQLLDGTAISEAKADAASAADSAAKPDAAP